MIDPTKAKPSNPSNAADAADFYSESGMIPAAAFTIMPIVCFSLATLGAIVYAYLMYGISIVYIHLVIAVAFAFGLGRFVNWAIARWRVRSLPYSLLFAAATSAVAYYSAWAADILARFGFEAVDDNPLRAWSPLVLAEYISGFYQVGYWRINGGAVNGSQLALHWLVEAALFFGFPLYEVWKNRNSRSFCEGCNRWTDFHLGVMRYYPGREAELAKRLAQQDFAALEERLGVPDSEDVFLRMNVHICPGCRLTRHVTIERVFVITQENGAQKIDVATIVDRMEVDDDTFQRICPPKSKVGATIFVPPSERPTIGPPPGFN